MTHLEQMMTHQAHISIQRTENHQEFTKFEILKAYFPCNTGKLCNVSLRTMNWKKNIYLTLVETFQQSTAR